ncbi:hypothetical protein ACFFU9_00750 [Mariniflexile ostreae]|uniref:Subunit length determinant protein n=1 Tax=Mariniflexile ostreae TaxID=1520892 RepID=A0ABV5F735_9FLAO
MSKDLPQPQPSEEVDLGQLFKLIGNTFDRFFRFIGSIFKSLFLAFVWFVFFIKKHILKFVIAGFVGIGIGFLLEEALEPVFKSSATIKQNYLTGENLYNSISYYKDLVKQKDVNTLQRALGIQQSEAASILDFDVIPVIDENQRLKKFNDYIKTLDTAVSSKVKYENYIENFKDYDYEYQQIAIKAKARSNFKKVFDKIIENIDNNEFFEREHKKELTELKNEESFLLEALMQSEALQNTYKRVLEKGLDGDKASQTSITIEGASQINKTKELDLYKSDLELRDRLVQNKRKQADKQFIVEVVSSKQESGMLDKTKVVFGTPIGAKKYYTFGLILLTFIVLLGIEFIKFLEKHKTH